MIENILINVLTYEIFSNSIYNYLIFIIFIVLGRPFSRVVNHFVSKYLLIWSAKSKVKFDDILVESINPSITMFIFAGAFYFGTRGFVGSIIGLIEKVQNFLLIIPLVYFMIKFSTEFVKIYLKDSKHGKKNEAAIDMLISLIRIALFAVGVLLILDNLDYDVSALIAGLGVGGLAFALAAQDLLKNFFAGISLIFDKTFNKGERVEFEGKAGMIEELKFRSTKLRTYDGTLLTIPNAMLADNIVENVTKVPRVKVKMTLGVTYDTSSEKLREAKKIIMDALKKQPDVNEESATIYFDNFGPYSLDIQVYYYAKKLTMNDWTPRVKMKEDVNFMILEGFEKAKIEFAFPTQTVEIKK